MFRMSCRFGLCNKAVWDAIFDQIIAETEHDSHTVSTVIDSICQSSLSNIHLTRLITKSPDFARYNRLSVRSFVWFHDMFHDMVVLSVFQSGLGWVQARYVSRAMFHAWDLDSRHKKSPPNQTKPKRDTGKPGLLAPQHHFFVIQIFKTQKPNRGTNLATGGEILIFIQRAAGKGKGKGKEDVARTEEPPSWTIMDGRSEGASSWAIRSKEEWGRQVCLYSANVNHWRQ
jgi:hypothetical protein